jgi:hypothetical protein
LKESLTVTVLDSFDESIYWTPQLFHLGSSLGTSDNRLPQFYPQLDKQDVSAGILPEGDMLCTTKVPIHVFYGNHARITFAYASPAQVDNELKKLLAARNLQRSQRQHELLYLEGVISGTVGSKSNFCPSLISNKDERLQRALSMLGFPSSFDITELTDDDVLLPEHVMATLGRVFTCSLKNCTSFQDLVYIKNVLHSVTCGNHSRWGLLNFISLEIPSTRLKSGVEIVDLPGFEGELFDDSCHIKKIIGCTTRLIHVCDERKLDGDFSKLFTEQFLHRMIREEDEFRLVSVCNKRYQKAADDISTESLLKVKSRGLDFNIS